jgi:hypothetical protein
MAAEEPDIVILEQRIAPSELRRLDSSGKTLK